MSAVLPIYAPDGVERALLAQAGQSIPVAVALSATRPPKFSVPAPSAGASKSGSGSPVGTTTPDFVGQAYNDTSDSSYWISTGLENTDWSGPFVSGDVTTPLGSRIGYNTTGDLGVASFSSTQKHNLGGVLITSTSTLLSIDFPNLIDIDPANTQEQSLVLENNSGLLTAEFPALTTIGNALNIQNNNALTSVSFSSLVSVPGGSIIVENNTALASLAFPALAPTDTVVSLTSNTALTSLSLPVVVMMGQLYLHLNTALTSLSMPNFATGTGGVYIFGNGFVSLSLPELHTVTGDVQITFNSSLATISIPQYHPSNATTDSFVNNALTVATVNSILALYAANGLTAAGVLDLSGQTPSAPPSGAGITNKALLVTNGWTVTTD